MSNNMYVAPSSKDVLDASDVASAAVAYAISKWVRNQSDNKAMEWALRSGLYSAGGRILEAQLGSLGLPMMVQSQYAYSGLLAVAVDIAMKEPASGFAESALMSAGSNFLGDLVAQKLLGGDFKIL